MPNGTLFRVWYRIALHLRSSVEVVDPVLEQVKHLTHRCNGLDEIMNYLNPTSPTTRMQVTLGCMVSYGMYLLDDYHIIMTACDQHFGSVTWSISVTMFTRKISLSLTECRRITPD